MASDFEHVNSASFSIIISPPFIMEEQGNECGRLVY